MKKNGYTLTEAVIALGIVGVLASMIGPMVNKFKPDVNKVMFLKTYDSICEVVKNIVNNDILYPEPEDSITIGENIISKDVIIEYPLLDNSYVTWNGKSYPATPEGNKFCELLADGLNKTLDSEGYSDFCTPNGVCFKFYTPNGVHFEVTPEPDLSNSKYKTTIKFDVNGEKSPNSFYEDGVTNADQFTLYVTADGRVLPGDELAQLYLNTRTNWKKQELGGLEKFTVDGNEFKYDNSSTGN